VSKIGKSHQQPIKNHLWDVWYWTSLFRQFHNREPNIKEVKHLNKILKSHKLEGFVEWAHAFEHVHTNNERMNIKLWNKASPPYHDDDFQYIVNHKTGIIYVIDKLQQPNIAIEALKDGYYTIYRNKFAFQQYIDNKIRKGQRPGTNKLVGRSCSINKFIYVKSIADSNQPIVKRDKKKFAKRINTRSNNLPHYYDKVRGHKGYWISLNPNSPIFEKHSLPKYGHYTKSSITIRQRVVRPKSNS
jgi:hypothetical protein